MKLKQQPSSHFNLHSHHSFMRRNSASILTTVSGDDDMHCTPRAPFTFKKRALNHAIACALAMGMSDSVFANFIAPNCMPDPTINGNGVTLTQIAEVSCGIEANNYGTVNNQAAINNLDGGVIYNGSYNMPTGTFNNTATGTINNFDDIENYGTFNNNDGGVINNYDDIRNHEGTFTNSTYGTINNGVGTPGSYIGADDIINYATFINHGTITNRADADIKNYGTGIFKNYGLIENAASGDEIDNDDDATFINGGTITNRSYQDNDGTFNNLAAGTINNHDYLLNDRGTLNNYGRINNFAPILGENEFDNNDDGTLNNFAGGKIYNYSYQDNDGELNNMAGALIDNHSYFLNERGTVNNAGMIKNQASGLLLNESEFNVNAGGVVASAGVIRNIAGDFVIDIGGTVTGLDGSLGDFRQEGGNTIVNGSLMADDIDILVGGLGGTGNIIANNFEVGENVTFAPGNSPGTLNVTGSVSFDGLLEIAT